MKDKQGSRTALASHFPHSERNVFRDGIQFTAARTEFPPDLIEKDYFCSLILRELYKLDGHELVFKGGTSLNKVHAGFYRLSEDLDFSVSISINANRPARRRLIEPAKNLLITVIGLISEIRLRRALTGSNESTQYNAEVEYQSCLSSMPGLIRMEIGLREPVLKETTIAAARTLVLDPFRELPWLEPFDVRVLDIQEAYAEKMRAALSRNTPAIRDLFDIDFAIKEKRIDFFDPIFQELVLKKLSIPGNGKPTLDTNRKSQMLSQVETELRPVLRPKDFELFEFEKAWSNLVFLGEKIQNSAR